MSENFTCPACGAPARYEEGSGSSTRCSYCNSRVPLPAWMQKAGPHLADEPAGAGTQAEEPRVVIMQSEPFYSQPGKVVQRLSSEQIKQSKTWLIILLLVIIVPTCIGILVSLIGALVGILAPFLAILFAGR